MKKNELLVDYWQRCGAEIGSFDCCQSSTNKSLRAAANHADPAKKRRHTSPKRSSSEHLIGKTIVAAHFINDAKTLEVTLSGGSLMTINIRDDIELDMIIKRPPRKNFKFPDLYSQAIDLKLID